MKPYPVIKFIEQYWQLGWTFMPYLIHLLLLFGKIRPSGLPKVFGFIKG
jgi:hypothetical protein